MAATRKALEGSIKKWRKIVKGTGVDNGMDNCPLCKMFATDLGCDGCPVFERTGFHSCVGTPYAAWMFVTDNMNLYGSARARTKRQIAAAQRELDFLISLRP